MQTAQQTETFSGLVENAIPHSDICWIKTDAGEVLFCHRIYTRSRKLPEIGARVTGKIGRVQNGEWQAHAYDVEVQP